MPILRLTVADRFKGHPIASWEGPEAERPSAHESLMQRFPHAYYFIFCDVVSYDESN